MLRTDGFSSVRAPYEGGEMVTQDPPVQRQRAGDQLRYLGGPAACGWNPGPRRKSPSPVSRRTNAVRIIGDQIERVVSWKGGSDLSRIAGQPVRLRFVMKDADLYSLQFR